MVFPLTHEGSENVCVVCEPVEVGSAWPLQGDLVMKGGRMCAIGHIVPDVLTKQDPVMRTRSPLRNACIKMSKLVLNKS